MYQDLAEQFSGQARINFPIRRLTTLRIGGPADLVLRADTPDRLLEALKLVRQFKVNYFVIAGGSNLVFSDKGFRGAVVHNVAEKMVIQGAKVRVSAGYDLRKFVRDLAKKNLGGIDFLGNVPGSVGGAVVGNAGCYGKAIGEYVESVQIFDMKTAREKTVLPRQMKFSYRDSVCKIRPEWVVLGAIMNVRVAKRSEILKAVEAERMERWRKHPRQPSAGSFFKNINSQPTWKLIDAVGLRGKTIGGARVSTKHPNFIVNVGGAKAFDVRRLVVLIQQKVRQKLKVKLETEVRLVDEIGVVS